MAGGLVWHVASLSPVRPDSVPSRVSVRSAVSVGWLPVRRVLVVTIRGLRRHTLAGVLQFLHVVSGPLCGGGSVSWAPWLRAARVPPSRAGRVAHVYLSGPQGL